MNNVIITGHDKTFHLMFRMQYVLMKHFNPSVKIKCMMADNTIPQFSDQVEFFKPTLPEFISKWHTDQNSNILTFQFCRQYLPNYVDSSVDSIGWMDGDILPVSDNSIEQMFIHNMPVVTEPEQHGKRVRPLWQSVCNWYGYEYIDCYNSGLVIAPRTHEFWELWQNTARELYENNSDRLAAYTDTTNIDCYPEKYNFFWNGVPFPLWCIDQFSLSLCVKQNPKMFHIADRSFNHLILDTESENSQEIKHSNINTKNIHLISEFKKCLLMK